MVSDFQSISNQCYDALIEPFNQGYCNLRDGLFGTKVDSVAQNVIATAAPTERNLSLGERVSAVVVGILLVIPVINAVVYAILKIASSDLLYPTKSTIVLEPIAPVSVDPISPEEMIARKRAALTRLDEIEAMVRPGQQPLAEISGRFEASAHILQFNLQNLLNRYQTNHTPSKLYDFMDWAGIPDDDRRNAFRMAVDPFNGRTGDDHQATVKGLMSNLAEYFVQQQAIVGSGTPAETVLKEQFTRVYDSIIDANNNCIDQMLSQMQGLVLDVIAEGDSGRGSSVQLKIVNRAGLALCKYRTSLLKEILVRQNPGQAHMADLERVATQRVAEALGMQGNIFAAGARFGHVLGNVDEPVNRAVQTFLDEYKPMEHLLADLSGYAGNHRTLRADIFLWANTYFDIGSETQDNGSAAPANLPDGTPAPHMDPRMSDDFATLPALSDGGVMKISGVALLLDTLGLIRQAGAQATT